MPEPTKYARETTIVPFAGVVLRPGAGERPDEGQAVVAVEILKIRERQGSTGLYADSGRIEVRPIGLNGYIELNDGEWVEAH